MLRLSFRFLKELMTSLQQASLSLLYGIEEIPFRLHALHESAYVCTYIPVFQTKGKCENKERWRNPDNAWIECAADYFGKMGILLLESARNPQKQTVPSKGSFIFYFKKARDDLATAVTEYLSKSYWNNFKIVLCGNELGKFYWRESFDFYLKGQMDKHFCKGCLYAVMGYGNST